jgi:hypothetical protein
MATLRQPVRRIQGLRTLRALIAALLLLAALPFPHAGASAGGHLKTAGSRFLTAYGHPFEWRGITAFRLVEFVAHGREREADAYLRCAASKKLTVVRVLVMAEHMFKLSPDQGLRALPRFLEFAKAHGLHVEVVALADTAAIPLDVPAHVRAVAEICGRHPNALLEIANEPVHPTQVKALHDLGYLQSLAKLIPAGVPHALGADGEGQGVDTGTYITWHAPRGGPKGWVAEIARGAEIVRRYNKPVINDEPMGAAQKAIEGRRDNNPRRFREAAAASRRAGLGATFHYEGGLQAKRPNAVELRCLDAWLAGLSGG